jgi:hypothetical protein
MPASCLDVAQGTSALELDFVGTKRANRTGRHPNGEHSRCNLRPWGDDGTRPNPGVLSNFCSVENDRPDPDQRTVSDAAAMHDRTMSDADLVTQNCRIAIRSDVQGRLILDIGSLADADAFHIASQDGSVEDARVRADLDVADDGCAWRNPHSIM